MGQYHKNFFLECRYLFGNGSSIKSIESLNIPSEILDFFKWLSDVLVSLEIRYSGIFSSKGSKSALELLGIYGLRPMTGKIEEIRRKL